MIEATHSRRGQKLIHQVLMMNPMHYYHTPVKPISTRASCPVCHQTVYSRAGIHPQKESEVLKAWHASSDKKPA